MDVCLQQLAIGESNPKGEGDMPRHRARLALRRGDAGLISVAKVNTVSYMLISVLLCKFHMPFGTVHLSLHSANN